MTNYRTNKWLKEYYDFLMDNAIVESEIKNYSCKNDEIIIETQNGKIFKKKIKYE